MVFSTNKTACQDLTEILLKVALKTINQTKILFNLNIHVYIICGPACCVSELGGNDIVTGISDEQLPAELLSNSTMRSGHLDSTASNHCADINLTSSSGAQSIIESQMDDLMKQVCIH